jgi:hypothetical protein
MSALIAFSVIRVVFAACAVAIGVTATTRVR